MKNKQMPKKTGVYILMRLYDLIVMKMKMIKKNKSHKYDIHKPRP